MDAGLVVSWPRLEVSVTGTFAGSGSGSEQEGAASANSYWAEDIATWAIGISVGVQYVRDLAGVETVTKTLSIPELAFSGSVAGSGSSGTSMVRFVDWKLYCEDTASWLATWSAVEWYVDGVLEDSQGSGSLAGTYLCPAGVPLFGMPPTVAAGATIDPVPAIGTVVDSTFDVDVTAQASGGWRVYDGSGYVELPVLVQLPTPGSHGGPCACEPETPSITGQWSHSLTANARCRYQSSQTAVEEYECGTCASGTLVLPTIADVHDATTTFEQYSSQATALPNLEKSIHRLGGGDSFALWFRFGLPATYASWGSACDTAFPVDEGTHYENAALVAYHPRRSSILSGVNQAVHALESTFGDPSYAPAEWSSLKWTATETYAVVSQVGACDVGPGPDEPPIECWPVNDSFCMVQRSSGFAAAVEDSGDVDMPPHYSHVVGAARYLNTVCSPHWSILLWFPPDLAAEAPAASYEWRVYGARANPSEYWEPIRTQFCSHPALPRHEDVLRRTSIVAEPLMSGGLDEWIAANLFGQLTSWVGVSRFDLLDYTIPSTYAYTSASSALWSATDCVLTHGASITVNPSALSCAFELDLADFATEPYLLAQIATKFKIEWTATNVAAMAVYLVNPHGDKVLLTEASSATPVIRPQGTDSKYAGSWGQDFGNGFLADTGTDQDAAGESATVCASDERVAAFQLLRGWSAAKLRYELTVTDHTVDCTVAYPVLTLPSGAARTDVAKVVHENGNWQDVVWQDGAGIRYGQWSWWDGASLLASPTVLPIGWPWPIGWMSSVLDMLCWKRVVYQGDERSDGLDTEQQAIYDSVENAGSTADERYDRTDTHTHSFFVDGGIAGIGALVNSFREVPPAANLPVYDRSDTTLVQNADIVQKTWTFSKRPRVIVAPSGSNIKLIDPDTGQDWLTPSPVVPGWGMWRHDRQVDNSEGPSFELHVSNTDYAHVSPWHGYFAVLPRLVSGANPWNYHLDQDHYHRTAVIDGDVWYFQVNHGHPLPGFDQVSQVTSGAVDSHPRMCIDPLTQRMHLVFVREDGADHDLYECTSDDDGKTWSAPSLLIADGRFPTVASSRDGTMVAAAFKYNSGTSGPGKIYTTIRKMGEAAWSTPVAITDGTSDLTFEEDTFHVSQAFHADQCWILVARPEGSADVEEFRSYDDCQSFEMI